MRQHRGMRPLAWLLVLWAANAGAQSASYVLDAAHSFVHFEVLHFGTDLAALVDWLDASVKSPVHADPERFLPMGPKVPTA